MRNDCSFEDNFHGSVTVGERGQIVIPAEARKKFGIETGDKLLVFSHPSGGGLMIAKFDALEGMLRFFSDTLARTKEEMARQEEDEADSGSGRNNSMSGV